MTYEYQCKDCQHQWEAEQSIKDKPILQCPQCLANSAKRLISNSGHFILKGTGWYKDGY